MRDPARIPELLDELKTLWERHPDWRFSQLIFNTLSGIWDGHEAPFFYMSDDDTLDIIRRRLEDGF